MSLLYYSELFIFIHNLFRYSGQAPTNHYQQPPPNYPPQSNNRSNNDDYSNDMRRRLRDGEIGGLSSDRRGGYNHQPAPHQNAHGSQHSSNNSYSDNNDYSRNNNNGMDKWGHGQSHDNRPPHHDGQPSRNRPPPSFDNATNSHYGPGSEYAPQQNNFHNSNPRFNR